MPNNTVYPGVNDMMTAFGLQTDDARSAGVCMKRKRHENPPCHKQQESERRNAYAGFREEVEPENTYPIKQITRPGWNTTPAIRIWDAMLRRRGW